MRFGLSIPNLAEPAELVELGVTAEGAGWDGVFLWDHVVGTPDFPVPMADTWVVLGALATRTTRVRLGTTITALPRRQPQEVARQSVTVDRLSGGRMVLGVGLGEPPSEYTALGRSAEPRVLAAQLDESLEVIAGLWTGEPYDHRGEHVTIIGAQFLPTPVQQPRIPVWASAMQANERTLGRAARWDGVILGAMTAEGGIDVLPPAAVADAVSQLGAPVDVIVATPGLPSGAEVDRYAEAGATWVLATAWIDQIRDMAASTPPAG